MDELFHLGGVGLAIGAAVCSAVSNFSVRKATERGSTSDAVFVVAAVNVAILLPAVGVAYRLNYGLTCTSLLSFIVAGVLGTLIGWALMFASINEIGASRTAPIIASWALITTALGVLFLDGTLSAIHGVGVVLVVAGIAVIAWKTSDDNPDDLLCRELLVGMSIPFMAALAIGWEPIFADVGFSEGTPALVGLVVKSTAAITSIGVYPWWRDELPSRSILRGTNER